MKKSRIIKDSKMFDYIINNGSIIKGKYYNIFYINNDDNKKLFGIAVGKKIGKAVVRNKQKRQIKNIIDNNDSLFSNDKYYIIMLKKDITLLSYAKKEEELQRMFNKGANYEK